MRRKIYSLIALIGFTFSSVNAQVITDWLTQALYLSNGANVPAYSDEIFTDDQGNQMLKLTYIDGNHTWVASPWGFHAGSDAFVWDPSKKIVKLDVKVETPNNVANSIMMHHQFWSPTNQVLSSGDLSPEAGGCLKADGTWETVYFHTPIDISEVNIANFLLRNTANEDDGGNNDMKGAVVYIDNFEMVTTSHNVKSDYVQDTPVIDGDISADEWGMDLTSDNEEKLLYSSNLGAVENVVAYKTSWDNDNLYVVVAAQDNNLEVGTDAFTGDVVNIAIGTDIAKRGLDNATGDEPDSWWDPGDAMADGFGIDGDDIYGASFVYDPSQMLVDGGDLDVSAGVEFVFKAANGLLGTDKNGYIFEAKIPWTALNHTPAEGNKFLVEVNVVDKDHETLGYGDYNDPFVSLAAPGELTLIDTKGVTPVDDAELVKLSVSPNPASDYLLLEASNKIDNVKIFSIGGILLNDDNLGGVTNASVSLGNLASGVYIVKITADGVTKAECFIKE